MYVFFFFKQKTAYEMRISDWSSDVCSSDLSLAELHNRSRYCRSSGSQSFVGFGFQEQDERNCGADDHYCDIENHIIASGRFSCPGGEHRADRHHCEEWHGQAQDPPDKGWAEYPGEQRGLPGRQGSRAATDKAHPAMEARSPRENP